MNIYMTDDFYDWRQSEKYITDEMLIQAVKEVAQGLHNGDYKGGVYKKRIANKTGQGSSGGSRMLTAYHANKHTFIIEGFSKNVKVSHDASEKKDLRNEAKYLFALNKKQIETWCEKKLLFLLAEEVNI